jgi:hypothetical protein
MMKNHGKLTYVFILAFRALILSIEVETSTANSIESIMSTISTITETSLFSSSMAVLVSFKECANDLRSR